MANRAEALRYLQFALEALQCQVATRVMRLVHCRTLPIEGAPGIQWSVSFIMHPSQRQSTHMSSSVKGASVHQVSRAVERIAIGKSCQNARMPEMTSTAESGLPAVQDAALAALAVALYAAEGPEERLIAHLASARDAAGQPLYDPHTALRVCRTHDRLRVRQLSVMAGAANG